MEVATNINPVDDSAAVVSGSVTDYKPAWGTPEWHKWRTAKAAEAHYGDRASKEFDWSSLPARATLQEEVEWVYLNYSYVVRTSDAGKTRMLWDKMVSSPPSQAARGFMEWAAENRTAFYKDLMPKVRFGGGEDEVRRRHDKKLVGEIEAALELLDE